MKLSFIIIENHVDNLIRVQFACINSTLPENLTRSRAILSYSFKCAMTITYFLYNKFAKQKSVISVIVLLFKIVHYLHYCTELSVRQARPKGFSPLLYKIIPVSTAHNKTVHSFLVFGGP